MTSDLVAEMQVEGLEKIRPYFDSAAIRADVEAMHRKFSFQLMRKLILTCSVDTGRARSGFTALLDRHGINYSDAFRRRSPYQTKGASDTNEVAIAEGKAKGRVIKDDKLEIVIGNAVDYVEFINAGTQKMAGTHFMDFALVRGAQFLDKLFNWYVDEKLKQARFQASEDPDEGPGEIPT